MLIFMWVLGSSNYPGGSSTFLHDSFHESSSHLSLKIAHSQPVSDRQVLKEMASARQNAWNEARKVYPSDRKKREGFARGHYENDISQVRQKYHLSLTELENRVLKGVLAEIASAEEAAFNECVQFSLGPSDRTTCMMVWGSSFLSQTLEQYNLTLSQVKTMYLDSVMSGRKRSDGTAVGEDFYPLEALFCPDPPCHD